MYDLKQAAVDFPWTRVKGYAPVEPWREDGDSWFDDLLEGWGDVIHEYLLKIDKTLDEYGVKDKIVLAQVKEKFGLCRVYFDITEDGESVFLEKYIDAYEAIRDLFEDMEHATSEVCCYCGIRDDLHWRNGWIHVSCDECEDRVREEFRKYLEEQKKKNESLIDN